MLKKIEKIILSFLIVLSSNNLSFIIAEDNGENSNGDETQVVVSENNTDQQSNEEGNTENVDPNSFNDEVTGEDNNQTDSTIVDETIEEAQAEEEIKQTEPEAPVNEQIGTIDVNDLFDINNYEFIFESALLAEDSATSSSIVKDIKVISDFNDYALGDAYYEYEPVIGFDISFYREENRSADEMANIDTTIEGVTVIQNDDGTYTIRREVVFDEPVKVTIKSKLFSNLYNDGQQEDDITVLHIYGEKEQNLGDDETIDYGYAQIAYALDEANALINEGQDATEEEYAMAFESSSFSPFIVAKKKEIAQLESTAESSEEALLQNKSLEETTLQLLSSPILSAPSGLLTGPANTGQGFNHTQGLGSSSVPNMQQASVSGDGITIEKLSIKWKVKNATGKEDNLYGTYDILPVGDNIPYYKFQIDYALSGKGRINPGDVEIVIPAFIWKTRDGREAGLFNISTKGFEWRRVDDNIVITNKKELPASTSGFIQGVWFNTSPNLDVEPSVFTSTYAHEIVDIDSVDPDNTPYGYGSDDLMAVMTVKTPQNGEVLTLSSNTINATLNTSVAIQSTYKTILNQINRYRYYQFYSNATDAKVPSVLLENLPTGTSPDDYYYAVWYVDAKASGNQAFDLTIQDTAQALENTVTGETVSSVTPIMLGSTGGVDGIVKSDDKSTITYKLIDGFSLTERSSSVYTAYKKSEIDALSSGKYKIKNTENAKVVGKDDGIESSLSDSYEFIIQDYHVVKIWDDDNNSRGKRPESINVSFINYSANYRSNIKTRIYTLSDENAWTATHWDIEGVISGVDESGLPSLTLVDEYETIDSNKTKCSYRVSEGYRYVGTTHDRETRTFTITNKYDRWVNNIGCVSPYVHIFSDSLIKDTPYRYNNLKSINDKLVNELKEGRDITIPYSVNYGGDLFAIYTIENANGRRPTSTDELGKNPVLLEIEDDLITSRNLNLGIDDYDIEYVNFYAANERVYVGGDIYKPWTLEKATTKNDLILYGRGENEDWKEYARYSNGVISVANNATLSGQNRVILPKGVKYIKESIETKNHNIGLSFGVGLKVYATNNVSGIARQMLEDADWAMAAVTNHVTRNVYLNGTKVDVGGGQDSETAYIHGKNTKLAVDLDKVVYQAENDRANYRFAYSNVLTLYQQTNAISLDELNFAEANGYFKLSDSGTFYDLLPPGMTFDESSLTIRNGTIKTVDVIENYKQSGRQLVIIRADLDRNYSNYGNYASNKNSDPYYPNNGRSTYGLYHSFTNVSFKMWYTYEEAANRGTLNLWNTAAYEADEAEFGNINTWRGEPDDPSAGNHKESSGAMPNDSTKNLMTDLDPNRNDPVFVYASGLLPDRTWLSSGLFTLEKMAQKVGDGDYWRSGQNPNEPVTVAENQKYSYNITLTANDESTVQNIIFIDEIEGFEPYRITVDLYTSDKYSWKEGDIVSREELEAERARTGNQIPAEPVDYSWRGVLRSVDTSEMRAMQSKEPADGFCNPIVYYYFGDLAIANLAPNLIANNPGKEEDLIWDEYFTTANGWYKEEEFGTRNISEATAIAIDCRRTDTGKKFVLDGMSSLIGYVHMRSIAYEGNESKFSSTDYSNPENNAYAYNSVYVNALASDVAGMSENSFKPSDYTKVGIAGYDFPITKIWDDADDNDGLRPDSIEITIKQKDSKGNYTNFERTETMSPDANGDWKHVFEHIPLYDEDGRSYTFEVEEFAVPGYPSEDRQSRIVNGAEYQITNKHTLERVNVPFEKVWINGSDEEGWESTIPDSIVVQLYQVVVDEQTGEEKKIYTGNQQTVRKDPNSNTWSGVFENVLKYNKGKEIVYVVEEKEIPEDYYMTVDRATNTITNTYYPYGDIKISKTVLDGTDLANNTPFTFSLTLEDKQGNPFIGKVAYTIRSSVDDSVLSSGEIGSGERFTLMHNQYMYISDVDNKLNYSVTEEPVLGFTLTSSRNTSGAVKSSAPADVAFVNTYSTKGRAQINLTKQLTGKRLESYQFRFELLDENGNVVRSATNRSPVINPGSSIYELNEAQASFPAIQYTNKDDGKTFTYRIREVNKNVNGYTYDNNEYTVQVLVSDNGDGTMTCTPTYFDSSGNEIQVEDVIFKNTYEANGETTLNAYKELNGGEYRQLANEEFEFELLTLDGNKLVPFVMAYKYDTERMAWTNSFGQQVLTIPDDAKDENGITYAEYISGNLETTGKKFYKSQSLTAKNNAEGLITFPTFKYDETDVGTKTIYVIREIKGSDPEIVYDESLKAYSITVIDNGDGTLSFDQLPLDTAGMFDDINGELLLNANYVETIGDAPQFVNKLNPGDLTISKIATNSEGTPISSTQEFKFKVKFLGKDIDSRTFTIENNLATRKLRYTLTSNANSRISDILSGFGITGTISDVVSSNNSLIEVSNSTGEWMISEKSQFDTQEWIKVTVDGEEHTILLSSSKSNATGFTNPLNNSIAINNKKDNELNLFTTVEAQPGDVVYQGTAGDPTTLDWKVVELENGKYELQLGKDGEVQTYSPESTFWSGSWVYHPWTFARWSESSEIPKSVVDNIISTRFLGDVQLIGTFGGEDAIRFFPYRTERIYNLEYLDTSRVTDFGRMFGLSYLKEPIDVSTIDVSHSDGFSGLSYMFDGYKPNRIYGLETWDVSNVFYVNNMFNNTNLIELDLSNWELPFGKTLYGRYTLNVERMFNGATIHSLDISGWQGPLGRMFEKSKIMRINLGASTNIYDSYLADITNNVDRNIYTGMWVREDTIYGPMPGYDLERTYNRHAADYAGWWVLEKYPSYFIDFVPGDGASGSMRRAEGAPKVMYELPVASFYKPGYRFIGWKDINSNEEYLLGSGSSFAIPANTYSSNQVVTLEALWKQRDDIVALEDEVQFSLYGGESITIKGIPSGTAYQVFEETPSGWTLVGTEIYEASSGSDPVYVRNGLSGVIKPKILSEVQATNQYTPNKAYLQLFGRKSLDNAAPGAGIFNFELRRNNYNYNSPIQRVSSQEGGAIVFEPLEFTETGYYDFYVSEVASSPLENIIYDDTVYRIRVQVRKNSNGELYFNNIDYYKGTQKVDEIVFNNKTEPGSLLITKQSDDLTPENKDTLFAFKVTLQNQNGMPLSSGDTITWDKIDANGNQINKASLGKRVLYSVAGKDANEEKATIQPINVVEEIDSGIYRNIAWSLTSDGILTLDCDSNNEMLTDEVIGSDIYPWSKYNSQINGTIYNGGLTPTVEPTSNASSKSYGIFIKAYAEEGDIYDEGRAQGTTPSGMDWKIVELSDGSRQLQLGKPDVEQVLSYQGKAYNTLGWHAYDPSRLMPYPYSSIAFVGPVKATGSLSRLFYNQKATEILNLNYLNVEEVTDATYMFESSSFREIDISGWKFNKVTNIGCMFRYARATKITLTNVQINGAGSMNEIFVGVKLNVLDLSSFYAPRMTANGMFQYAIIKEVVFNNNDAGFVMGTVMFCNATIDKMDLSVFDASKVTNFYSMFANFRGKSITGLRDWDVSNGVDFSSMFENSQIDSLDLSNWTFTSLSLSNSRGLHSMFKGAVIDDLNISGWDLRDYYNAYPSSGSLGDLMFYESQIEKITVGDNFRVTTPISTGSNIIYDDYWGTSYDYEEHEGIYGREFYYGEPRDLYTGNLIRESDGKVVSIKEFVAGLNDINIDYSGTWLWDTYDSYTIKFTPGEGGSGMMPVLEYKVSDDVGLPKNTFSREGYIFTGWYDAANNYNYNLYDPISEPNQTLIIPSNRYQKDQVVTLEAKWQKIANSYTVKYYHQNNTFNGYNLYSENTFSAEENEVVVAPVRTFTNFVSPDPKTITVLPNKQTVVEYYYDRKFGTIIYDGNGAKYGSMVNQEVPMGLTFELNKNMYSNGLLGDSFTGWNTERDGTGTSFSDLAAATLREDYFDTNGNLVLYAQWASGTTPGGLTPTEGVVYVYGKAGETIRIKDLPAGTTYTVEEVDIPDHWELESIDQSTGTIVKAQASSVTAKNKYSATGKAIINVHKKYEGDTVVPNQFAFELLDENGNLISTAYNGEMDTETQVSDENGNIVDNPWYMTAPVTFEIQYTHKDIGKTYRYTVREVQQLSDEETEYDNHVENITVYVEDAGDGVINAVVTYEQVAKIPPLGGKITKNYNGVYDGISWRLSTKGNLVIDASESDSRLTANVLSSDSYPWSPYIDDNTTVEFIDRQTVGAAINGTYAGLSWAIYEMTDGTGQLQIGTEGQTETYTKGNTEEKIGDWPWTSEPYRDWISSVVFVGNVVGDGDMRRMFQNSGASYIDMRNFDASNVTGMMRMFSDMPNLREINLTGLNTSNVRKISYWFAGSTNLEEIYGLETLDMSGLRTGNNTEGVFENVTKLTYLDMSGFTITSSHNTTNMFGTSSNPLNLKTVVLGPNFKINSNMNLIAGSWTNGSDVKTADEMADGSTAGVWYQGDVLHARTKEPLFVNKKKTGTLKLTKNIVNATNKAKDVEHEFTINLVDSQGTTLTDDYSVKVNRIENVESVDSSSSVEKVIANAYTANYTPRTKLNNNYTVADYQLVANSNSDTYFTVDKTVSPYNVFVSGNGSGISRDDLLFEMNVSYGESNGGYNETTPVIGESITVGTISEHTNGNIFTRQLVEDLTLTVEYNLTGGDHLVIIKPDGNTITLGTENTSGVYSEVLTGGNELKFSIDYGIGSRDANATGFFATLSAKQTTETTTTTYFEVEKIETVTLGSDRKIKLKGGESVVIEGLPLGTNYTITETPTEGWQLTEEINSRGEIVANVVKDAQFTNTYGSIGRATIDVTKLFNGGNLNEHKFKFDIIGSDSAVISTIETDETGHASYTFFYNQSDDGKTFEYKISEVIPADKVPNVKYDEHVERISISVNDNGLGELETTTVTDSDGIIFENSYDGFDLAIRKDITGQINEDEEFTFNIIFYDPAGIDLNNSEAVESFIESIRNDTAPRYTETIGKGDVNYLLYTKTNDVIRTQTGDLTHEVNTAIEHLTITNGQGQFTLKGGESILLQEFKDVVFYKVQEVGPTVDGTNEINQIGIVNHLLDVTAITPIDVRFVDSITSSANYSSEKEVAFADVGKTVVVETITAVGPQADMIEIVSQLPDVMVPAYTSDIKNRLRVYIAGHDALSDSLFEARYDTNKNQVIVTIPKTAWENITTENSRNSGIIDFELSNSAHRALSYNVEMVYEAKFVDGVNLNAYAVDNGNGEIIAKVPVSSAYTLNVHEVENDANKYTQTRVSIPSYIVVKGADLKDTAELEKNIELDGNISDQMHLDVYEQNKEFYYNLRTTIPNSASKFVLSDSIESLPGIVFDTNSIVVKIDGNDSVLTADVTENSFQVSLTQDQINRYAGTEISVRIKANLTGTDMSSYESVKSNSTYHIMNTASYETMIDGIPITRKSNVSDLYFGEEVGIEGVVRYSNYRKNDEKPYLRLMKIDELASERLGGALFKLEALELTGEINNNEHVFVVDGNGVPKIDATISGKSFETMDNGIKVVGIDKPGWYLLSEIAAPQGYLLSDEKYYVSVRDIDDSGINITNKSDWIIMVYRDTNSGISNRDAQTIRSDLIRVDQYDASVDPTMSEELDDAVKGHNWFQIKNSSTTQLSVKKDARGFDEGTYFKFRIGLYDNNNNLITDSATLSAVNSNMKENIYDDSGSLVFNVQYPVSYKRNGDNRYYYDGLNYYRSSLNNSDWSVVKDADELNALSENYNNYQELNEENYFQADGYHYFSMQKNQIYNVINIPMNMNYKVEELMGRRTYGTLGQATNEDGDKWFVMSENAEGTINDTEIKQVHFMNLQETIYKVDKYKQTPSAGIYGAEFSLTTLSPIATATYERTTDSKHIEVDGNGKYVFSEFDFTQDEMWYVLEETKAPAGYDLEDRPWFIQTNKTDTNQNTIRATYVVYQKDGNTNKYYYGVHAGEVLSSIDQTKVSDSDEVINASASVYKTIGGFSYYKDGESYYYYIDYRENPRSRGEKVLDEDISIINGADQIIEESFNLKPDLKFYYVYDRNEYTGQALEDNQIVFEGVVYTLKEMSNYRTEKNNEGYSGYLIENSKPYSLPSSGGIGTYLFTLFGSIVIALASIQLVGKWRRRKRGIANG